MKAASQRRLQIAISAMVSGGTCALLLGLPGAILNMGDLFVGIGAGIGVVLGACAVNGRVSPAGVGFAYGGLSGFAIGFGFDYFDVSALGDNRFELSMYFGPVWLVSLTFVVAIIGGICGYAFSSETNQFRQSIAWPIGTLFLLFVVLLWADVSVFLDDHFRAWSLRATSWGSELPTAAVIGVMLHAALYRLNKREADPLRRAFFWSVWLFWPFLVALTYLYLWKLNHVGGIGAWDEGHAADYFCMLLFGIAVIGNAYIVWQFEAVTRYYSFPSKLGPFFGAIVVHALTIEMIASGMNSYIE